MDVIQISVVIPVYRSEACLTRLVEELHVALSSSGRTWEVILVNDASPDRSWDRIREAVRQFPSILGIDLRRNFGQHNAILAGMRHAKGQVVVTMDDDLQHRPRDVERLVSQVESGWDVCYARFRARKHGCWKNLGSKFNARVAEAVIGKPRDVYLSPFRALSRGVVDELVKYSGAFPVIDGLIFRITDRITQVEVEHDERFAGTGNYNVFSSVALWLRLLTGHSVTPLRIAAYLGFASAALGLLLAAFFAYQKVTEPTQPIGWASLIVTVLVMGGVQLAGLGMIGEYLGRLYMNINQKPQFVVREVLSASSSVDTCSGRGC